MTFDRPSLAEMARLRLATMLVSALGCVAIGCVAGGCAPTRPSPRGTPANPKAPLQGPIQTNTARPVAGPAVPPVSSSPSKPPNAATGASDEPIILNPDEAGAPLPGTDATAGNAVRLPGASAAAPHAGPGIKAAARASRIPAVIKTADLMSHVSYLSQTIGPHPAGSRASVRASGYIASCLRSYGYRTSLQPFSTFREGMRTVNVIGSLPRGKGLTKLVVGAHYDTTPTSPGADDNASGVAVLLELARALARSQPAFDVTIVAFGAEELQHDGSRFYVKQALRSRTLPAGMINLDMVAIGQVFQIGSYGTDPWLMNHWVSAASGIPNLQPNAPFGGKSDYASFAAAGVPVAACAWDPEDPYKHSPRDSLAHLQSVGLLPSFKKQITLTANSLLAALMTAPAARADRARSRR